MQCSVVTLQRKGATLKGVTLEPLTAILELSCCLLEFLNAAGIVTNLVAWFRSQPYREARKNAKQRGEPPPTDDFWFQVFVFLTPITITLTGIIIYKWLR